MKPNTIKNFLNKQDFEKLENLIINDSSFPWFFQPNVSNIKKERKTDCYFTHLVYDNNKVNSSYFENFKNILDKLNVEKLIRIKVNYYYPTSKLNIHYPHIDYDYSHKGCILSLNTCDGFTVIENNTSKGLRIKSIKNSALIFDPSIPHSSTSCTNRKGRFNININYL